MLDLAQTQLMILQQEVARHQVATRSCSSA